MKIEIMKAFTMREATTGELVSYRKGAIVTVDDTLGTSLINDGFAREDKRVVPEGTITITENVTDVDVAEYASVTVNVGNYTVTYNVNGGTGTIDSQVVIAGNSIVLDDGTGLVAPEGKEFAGWGTTDDATTSVASPYTPTNNVTLYAIYSTIVTD